jgi:endo-1,4-beta-xylanase
MRIDSQTDSVNQFAPTVDWRRILGNWGQVHEEFAAGNIPLPNEVFNPPVHWAISWTGQQLEYAERHQYPIEGSHLYWWSDIIEPLYSNAFTAEEKRRIVEFTIKAKVLRYRGRIGRWQGAAEVSASEMPWFDARYRALYQQIGGRRIVHDAFVWAKEVAPEIELILVEAEPLEAHNDAYRQISSNFFGLLRDLKSRGTPVDKVAFENNFWIYDPSTKDEMVSTIRRVQEMGYAIARSEMVIAISEEYPIWPERPRTVRHVTDKYEAQAMLAADTLRAYIETDSEFGVFCGTDADTWWQYPPFNRADAEPEITDRNLQPKPAYYAMLDVLKQAALARGP